MFDVNCNLGRSFVVSASMLLVPFGVAGVAAPVDFDREIRPLLSDRCFVCHGPDGGSRQADLRLDTYGGLTESVVVPGDADGSELVRRILSDDESERMPPPDSRLSLSQDERELIRRWVEEGATFSGHWAFEPPAASVGIPPVKMADWPRTPIDRFILAALEEKKLAPSPRADRLRLLRRLTLDLTGLPPTVEEIEEFRRAVEVDFEGAINATVDRLLASSAYGQHMAVAWLDAARYADSFGYQSDQLNTQWPYRDWVVKAWNENLPYDEFITAQLAGDLLPDASRDDILATAFNRMNRLTNEGGSIAEEWLLENAADRLHTFGTAVLGLTLECARCHDHKYDPISQRDYFSLLAFFNSIDENGLYDHAAKVPSPSLLLPTADQEEALSAARERLVDAEQALREVKVDGEGRFQQWLAEAPKGDISKKEIARGNGERTVASDLAIPDLVGEFTFDDGDELARNHGGAGEVSLGAVKFVSRGSGNGVRFDGDQGLEFAELMKVDRCDSFTLDFWIRDGEGDPQATVVMHRTFGTDVGYNGFDVMVAGGVLDLRMYRVWPGNGIGVRAGEALQANQWYHVAIAYDGSSRADGFRLWIDGRAIPLTALRDRITKSASIATYGSGHFTIGQRFRDRGFRGGEIDELRIYKRALSALEVKLLHAGASPDVTPVTASEETLREYFFSALDEAARRASGSLHEARRGVVSAEEAIHEVSVMEELAAPRATYLLARGEYDSPKSDQNRVEREVFTEILPRFPEGLPRNRLGLARWATDSQHPLTARVFVNRIWANFFGEGLVTTPENFGRQGAAPSHPELLDWLARDFIENGWDRKRLCRQIVMSATYQQDSRFRAESAASDPENRFLARGPTRRLTAEQVRDLALAASGLLEQTMGGPPVAPYQPGADLWRESNQMSPAYRQSTGAGLYRRSLYSVWKRTAPLPNMTAFDAGSREVCIVSRSRTNTPLQALVLLNDVQFVEAARALADALLERDLGDAGRIRLAFVRLTGREPDPTEAELLATLLDEQREYFAVRVEEARKYDAMGESKVKAHIEEDTVAVELAALSATCQAIMNLDAAIYVR